MISSNPTQNLSSHVSIFSVMLPSCNPRVASNVGMFPWDRSCRCSYRANRATCFLLSGPSCLGCRRRLLRLRIKYYCEKVPGPTEDSDITDVRERLMVGKLYCFALVIQDWLPKVWLRVVLKMPNQCVCFKLWNKWNKGFVSARV